MKALKKLQFETVKAEEEYYSKVHALDLEYQKQYDEINAKRLGVIRQDSCEFDRLDNLLLRSLF